MEKRPSQRTGLMQHYQVDAAGEFTAVLPSTHLVIYRASLYAPPAEEPGAHGEDIAIGDLISLLSHVANVFEFLFDVLLTSNSPVEVTNVLCAIGSLSYFAGEEDARLTRLEVTFRSLVRQQRQEFLDAAYHIERASEGARAALDAMTRYLANSPDADERLLTDELHRTVFSPGSLGFTVYGKHLAESCLLGMLHTDAPLWTREFFLRYSGYLVMCSLVDSLSDDTRQPPAILAPDASFWREVDISWRPAEFAKRPADERQELEDRLERTRRQFVSVQRLVSVLQQHVETEQDARDAMLAQMDEMQRKHDLLLEQYESLRHMNGQMSQTLKVEIEQRQRVEAWARRLAHLEGLPALGDEVDTYLARFGFSRARVRGIPSAADRAMVISFLRREAAKALHPDAQATANPALLARINAVLDGLKG